MDFDDLRPRSNSTSSAVEAPNIMTTEDLMKSGTLDGVVIELSHASTVGPSETYKPKPDV